MTDWSRRRLILLLHRRIGLVAVPLVVILVATGIVLNHTEELELDANFLTSDWLLAWYGIDEAPADIVSYAAADVWVSWLGGTLYLDGAAVARADGRLAGAVAVGEAVVLAAGDAVYLFTREGELIEKVTPVGITGLAAIAFEDGEVLVRTADGVFASDLDLVTWEPRAAGALAWSAPETAPPSVERQVRDAYRGSGLPWERVLLDLHSGRLFGRIGPYIMDAAGVLLVLLAASGIYNWFKIRR